MSCARSFTAVSTLSVSVRRCRTTSAIAAATSATATTSVASAAVRMRMEAVQRLVRWNPARAASAIAAESVAGAALRRDRAATKGSSAFFRSRRTYTSTMFGSPSKEKSQTFSRISDFATNSSARRMRNSNTENSRLVSSISVPSRVTR